MESVVVETTKTDNCYEDDSTIHQWYHCTNPTTTQDPRCPQAVMILRQLPTNIKEKVGPKDRQGVVYKIKCCNFPATYIGEKGRNLNTHLTEHRRATKNGDNKN